MIFDAQRSRLFLALFLLLLLPVAACRSTDPSLYGSDGQDLSNMEPVYYRVAVAPVDTERAVPNPAQGPEEETKLAFAVPMEDLQTVLVRCFSQYHTSNEIVAIPSTNDEELRKVRADLLIVPRLKEEPYLVRAKASSKAAGAAALWFLTWIGGMYVEDEVYEARMKMDFDIVDPHSGEVVATVETSSGQCELAFVDRNPAASGSTAQSLVIPTFWTSDNKDKTSVALTDRICQRLTGQFTRYVKEEFVSKHRPRMGELRLRSPRNGAEVGPKVRLVGVVLAAEKVTRLSMYLNDNPKPGYDKAESDLPAEADQYKGNLYQVPFDVSLTLPKGRSEIGFEFEVAGRVSTRTVVVYNGGKPEKEK